MATAKLLRDTEMLDIIKRAVVDSEIDDSSQYKTFLMDLGALICDHFGGEPGEIDHDASDGLGWCMQFHHNECVPDGGGVFAKYHTDVKWGASDNEEEYCVTAVFDDEPDANHTKWFVTYDEAKVYIGTLGDDANAAIGKRLSLEIAQGLVAKGTEVCFIFDDGTESVYEGGDIEEVYVGLPLATYTFVS